MKGSIKRRVHFVRFVADPEREDSRPFDLAELREALTSVSGVETYCSMYEDRFSDFPQVESRGEFSDLELDDPDAGLSSHTHMAVDEQGFAAVEYNHAGPKHGQIAEYLQRLHALPWKTMILADREAGEAWKKGKGTVKVEFSFITSPGTAAEVRDEAGPGMGDLLGGLLTATAEEGRMELSLTRPVESARRSDTLKRYAAGIAAIASGKRRDQVKRATAKIIGEDDRLETIDFLAGAIRNTITVRLRDEHKSRTVDSVDAWLKLEDLLRRHRQNLTSATQVDFS